MDIPNCPFCNKKMKVRHGKRGDFYGCPAFPNCKGTRDYIVYPDPADIKLIPGSPEQEDIFSFLQNGTENAIIQARAGVGKSWTIVNSLMRLRGVKVGVFSFNTHIIKEMNEKLQKEGISWARGNTYNSFGFRSIRNNPQLQNSELFEDKLPTILNEILPDDTEESVIIRMASEKLVRLCKCYMDDGTNEDTLVEFVDKFNVDIDGDSSNYEEIERRTKRVFEIVPKALDLCLKRKSTLDFDDQVWWCVKMKLPVEKYDIVFVDESQDTNKMQQELLKMACP